MYAFIASFFAFYRPKTVFAVLDAVDQTAPSYTLNKPDALRRVFAVLACVSLSLLGIHYLKFSSTFTASIEWFASVFSNNNAAFITHIKHSGYYELSAYAWWTFWNVSGYILLPFLCTRYILRESFSTMGWRWNDTSKHWREYVYLLSPILVFVTIAAQGTAFVQHYPFYSQAGRSWFDFIAWECLYLLQFIALEFFFRGFILHALRPALGANALWVMCVPYMMIHLPKLWPEAFGAFFFGIFLGILALRSRSLWGGVCVHAGIAVGMDIASLIKRGALPEIWMY